ncbi:kexin [[Candida] railenensis]|uniref:Kexin n=1 Tax=[Candida] railenensis TaxID=45579 RepID=A0A9P0VXB7_9ASCO|nr:kexin [[Candida] railenensis]
MLLRYIFSLATFVSIVLASGQQSARIPKRDYENNHYFVVDIDTSSSSKPLKDFIQSHQGDFKFEHQVVGLDDHYVFSLRKDNAISEIMGSYNAGQSDDDRVLHKRDGFEDVYDKVVKSNGLRSISWMEPKRLKKRLPVYVTEEEAQDFDSVKRFEAVDASQKPIVEAMEKLAINDPIFPEQWHIINPRFPGHDINVTGLWYEGITGEGIVTAIIDDGLDYDSEDLKANFNKDGSWDFNENTNLPFPRLFDDYHGTRCAGEIGAVKNDVCGVGVAYGGKIAGIRILSGPITSDQEASALMYGLKVNDIYSCSWGPTDDGRTLSQPDLTVKKAMIKSVQEGRDGKGSVYVFASGNGGRAMDSCNFDGYTNSIYSITVGAVDYKGLHPTYAEACSAVMVVTYSSGSGEHIHTTDIKNKCSAAHGGTSAAAPIAAGVFQLVLQMNPNLTWRDLQYVCAMSSVPINEQDGNYQVTALGRKYSHKYGYGKLDAYAIGHFAKTWKNVKPQAWYYSDVITVGETIEGDKEETKVISKILSIKEDDLKIVNLERVEHITVTVNIAATLRGKVGMRLTSPFGIISDLATFRPVDNSNAGFKDWTFMSVAHWGESGIGDWKVEVFTSTPGTGSIIEFQSFQLRLFGESIDAEKTEVYDVTKDYAAERRDKQSEKEGEIGVDPHHTSDVISLSSTSIPIASEQSTSVTKAPIDDEVNPTGSIASTSTTSSSSSFISGSSSATGDVEDDEGKTKHYTSDHTGQYFMALAVVGFLVVIIFMRFHKSPGSSRRRRRREEYEFDIIPGEDYTDSEDDGNEEDSLDLGRYNNQRRTSDEERDRLYDEFNADTLPSYEDDGMFKIGGEEDEDHKPEQKHTKEEPSEEVNTDEGEGQSSK